MVKNPRAYALFGSLAAICLVSAAAAKSQADKPDAASPNLAKPLVVALDAGHGGSNVGAPSVSAEIFEKTVTAAITKKLASALSAREVQVVMVRNGDQYLTLRQRSAAANQREADVFVSIHANASPDHSRQGFETYFLSADAVDIDARALRTIAPTRTGLSGRVSRLVDDVERGLAHPHSAVLAATVQRELAKVRSHSPNRGVKQESMHVLLGATMPAVLVEVGFIDHPVEGRELLTSSVQQEVATAIADAVVNFARAK